MSGCESIADEPTVSSELRVCWLFPQAEIQEASLDGSSTRVASLERETRGQVKELEGLRETAERVRGLERDNRELAKQAAIDHRTLVTLREVRGGGPRWGFKIT